MMSRRRASGRAIVRDERAGKDAEPSAQDEHQLLTFADARECGTEDIELLRFELLQQAPIDRAHQFRGSHRAAVFAWKCFVGEFVKMFRAFSDARGELAEAWRIFPVQNLSFGHTEAH